MKPATVLGGCRPDERRGAYVPRCPLCGTPDASRLGMQTEANSFTTVNAFFTWDRERLDKALGELIALASDGHANHIESTFVHYERGMRRHIRLDEQIVFQLFAFDRTGATKASTQRIQAKHAEIIRQLDEMRGAITAHDLPRLRAIAVTLQEVFNGRDARDEDLVYPVLDSLLGAAEAEKLVTRLRAG
jgi:Hemerythrin HHE cation binding domain